MASLQELNGSYRVIFRHQGRQHFVTIGVVSLQEAEAKSAPVSYLLMRIKQGLIELPPGVGIAEFVEHVGKPPARLAVQSGGRTSVTLGALRDRFLATRATGREKGTPYTAGIHFKHMVASLGERFPLDSLAQPDLQRHIDRRAKLDRSPVTIKKEI